MIIKWTYDIEATVEEVKELIGMDQPKLEVVPEKKEDKPKTVKTTKKRKTVDVGKIHALRNAGWSITEIADEMGLALSTVSRRLKEA